MATKITLPTGVEIEYTGDVKVLPDGSLHIEGEPAETPTEAPEPVRSIDPTDLDNCKPDYNVDATILALLDPGVDRNVYLSVLDQILNISDVHFATLDRMFMLDDGIHYLELGRKMGITDGAILGRVQTLLRLNLIGRTERAIYTLDGVAQDVMDDWRTQIIAERDRRSHISAPHRDR